ncbi:AAA family ATPase [Hyphococcus formosus]|uniref:ParA family protein n=1 Tax=Hyphococcus formosus TaxID=3143534 RepID=UPI00398B0C8A
MKAVVFFNNKGGVGKTTLACNVVSYISQHFGKRVLLIDGDPQCNATQAFLDDDLCEEIYLSGQSKQKTIYNILQPLEVGEPSISGKVSPAPRSENLYRTDLLPGHPSLSTMEDRLSEAWSKLLAAEIPGFRISNWVEQLLVHYQDDYDLIVFDVGPSLGALNRTIILASDYIVAPFGCDIFSILGINNIATWIQKWKEDYDQSLVIAERKDRLKNIEKFGCITDTSDKFRLAGYSVQQYVSRKFKEGRRPVKAYDSIMKDIPTVVHDRLSFITPKGMNDELRLGDIPYVYSLVPLSQSSKTPIHSLASKDGVVGAQFKQVQQYSTLMDAFSKTLLENIGLA